MSLVGMLVLIGIAVLLSRSRKDIRLRTVGGAFALQFAFGALVLYFPFGKRLLIKFRLYNEVDIIRFAFSYEDLILLKFSEEPI